MSHAQGHADQITGSMDRTLKETNRRREKQLHYNQINQITPRQIIKSTRSLFEENREETTRRGIYADQAKSDLAADPVVKYMGTKELERAVEAAKKRMEKAARELDFIEAARFRDEMYAYQELLKGAAER